MAAAEGGVRVGVALPSAATCAVACWPASTAEGSAVAAAGLLDGDGDVAAVLDDRVCSVAAVPVEGAAAAAAVVLNRQRR